MMKKIVYYSAIPSTYKNIALVFDVETTGLLKKKHGNKLEDCPHVLQLSYAMYDCDQKQLLKTVDSYIKIPANVQIPKEASDVNHITSEMCAGGLPMLDVLKEFYDDYHKSTILVAHNYQFDSNMLTVEFERHWPELAVSHPYALNLFQYTYIKSRNMQHTCTMEKSTDLCKLAHKTSSCSSSTVKKEGVKERPVTYKWPSLLELNRFLFPTEPQPTNLHNSLVDVLVTLRCYIKMEYDYQIVKLFV
jgi:DNA polymerase-3 subunit epsilon